MDNNLDARYVPKLDKPKVR